MSSPHLAITCGLPRSGKSTYARHLARNGWVRICPDEYRLALHGQALIKTAEPLVWAMVEVSVRAQIIGGQRVILDSTGVTRQSRQQWGTLAREMGVDFTIFWVPTPLETCLARNQGVGAVPKEVLERFARDFDPPSAAEGTVITVAVEQ